MLKIAIAPRISHDMLDELSTTIVDHHTLLLEAYDVNLTAKDYLITHYLLVTCKMGPPRLYWTMRFESLNGYMKDLSKKLKNWKDIAFTLAKRHQIAMFSIWNENNLIMKTNLSWNVRLKRISVLFLTTK